MSGGVFHTLSTVIHRGLWMTGFRWPAADPYRRGSRTRGLSCATQGAAVLGVGVRNVTGVPERREHP
jgi:hypothetical protein